MNLAQEQSLPVIDDEEQARANFYALLARLFSAPPDDQLLSGIAESDEGESSSTNAESEKSNNGLEKVQEAEPLSLDAAWSGLAKAAANCDQGAVAEEYDRLFVASGRAEISLYLGAYTARSSVDTKLVALREFLESCGIQRQSQVHEPEDHISMLFEVMRYLIFEQQEIQEGNLAVQKEFFEAFVWSGAMELCDAISNNAHASFFESVAALTKSFLSVEHDAFEM